MVVVDNISQWYLLIWMTVVVVKKRVAVASAFGGCGSVSWRLLKRYKKKLGRKLQTFLRGSGVA